MMENKHTDKDFSSTALPSDENALSAFEQVTVPQKSVKKKRLSSNTRLLVIVVAIVAALAVALALLLPLLSDENGGSSTVSSTSDTNEEVWPLYDRSKDDTKEKIVQAVTIKNASDDYTIRYDKKEATYKLDGFTELSLSASVDEMIESATVLNGYDRVDKVENKAEFGLDKPSSTVTVTYHDGSVNTLLIGDKTPDEAGYYVCMQYGNEVYMADTSAISLFHMHKGQYLEKTLIAAPTVKSDDTEGSAVLKEMTLKGGPNNETLSIRRATTADGLEYSYSTFIVTKPYMRMVDTEVTDALNGFTALIAGEGVVLHPTAEQKKQYGFDSPYAVLDVTMAVETVVADESSEDEEDSPEMLYYNTASSTVTIGNKSELGNYYVMIDGVDVIYLVAFDSLSVVVERTYENTISDLLFLKDITKVSKLEVSIEGKMHTMLLSHDESKEDTDDQLTVTYNGKALKSAPFRTIYSALMSLSRYSNADIVPTGQPTYTMKLYDPDGSLFLSLELYATSGSLYTTKTNEGELFSVKASDVSTFIAQLSEYLAD